MYMREFLGIPIRRGPIPWKTKAKIRHNHAILIQAGKPRHLTAIVLAGQWDISLSSFYKIIK